MDILAAIVESIAGFFGTVFRGALTLFQGGYTWPVVFTGVARWVFIILGTFVLIRSILSLLRSRSGTEIWAYLHLENGTNLPITHWENAVGRGKSCDIQLEDMSISRNHGILSRDSAGQWSYMDLGSKNGAIIRGQAAEKNVPIPVSSGDEMLIGGVMCTLFPVSVEEHMKNVKERQQGARMTSPWPACAAITVFQILTVLQLMIALGDRYVQGITISFIGLSALMWAYVGILRSMKRRGFEVETIAFFLTTLSLAVEASKYPSLVLKQFIAAAIGVVLFFFMCAFLRDLKRTTLVKPVIYGLAAAALLINMFFATSKFGQSNWVTIGGVSVQPSELVKIAFVWVGAATMDELFQRKSSLIFTGFSLFCFLCLAKMGDFGTAIIFFATFLVIQFLRSGDFTKLIAVVGVAFVGGIMVLRFRSYVAKRFAVWGHVWEPANMNDFGYQQTRTMSAAASGGLIGVGAGKGWLHKLGAAETDLVFGVVAEEWGMIIAVLAVLCIVTLAVFAYRSIWSGRSTYYTIAGCAATTVFLIQTILNVFGSMDVLPLTGVTFPFLSGGGTSMVSAWGLLAFIKAADTRQNASMAVKSSEKGVPEIVPDGEEAMS